MIADDRDVTHHALIVSMPTPLGGRRVAVVRRQACAARGLHCEHQQIRLSHTIPGQLILALGDGAYRPLRDREARMRRERIVDHEVRTLSCGLAKGRRRATAVSVEPPQIKCAVHPRPLIAPRRIRTALASAKHGAGREVCVMRLAAEVTRLMQQCLARPAQSFV